MLPPPDQKMARALLRSSFENTKGPAIRRSRVRLYRDISPKEIQIPTRLCQFDANELKLVIQIKFPWAFCRSLCGLCPATVRQRPAREQQPPSKPR